MIFCTFKKKRLFYCILLFFTLYFTNSVLLNVTGQQEVRVLTLAEQIIAAIPERIKVKLFYS